MGKQVLIRVGDEFYEELNKEATAHRMTVQKYILAVLDSELGLTRQIDRNINHMLGDLYEARITNCITYGYLKKHLVELDEKLNIILNAMPDANALSEDEKTEIKEGAEEIETSVFKDIASSKDLFNMGRLYSMVNATNERKNSATGGEYEEG